MNPGPQGPGCEIGGPMQIKKRESNLDILRLLCCIVVATTHISSRYKAGITDPNVFGALITTNIPTIIVMDTVTRFVVPCFVMLAGAFALTDRNADYRSYYRKTFRTIWIPMLVFSVLYVVDGMAGILKLVLAGQCGVTALLDPIKAWILGAPSYHMWYLYSMIGVYILTPFIVRWKNSVSKETFRWCALGLLVLCVISGWTSDNKFHWDVGVMFYYSGYFVAGYVIRDMLAGKQNNWKSFAFILVAVAGLLLLSWIQYRHSLQGLAESDEVYPIIGTFNPLLAFSSVMLYTGFCLMKVSVNLDWYLKRSFLVYLFHAGVLTRLFRWILRIDIRYCAVAILVGAFFVLAISFVLSVIYEKVWAWLEKKWDISRRLTDLVIPEK